MGTPGLLACLLALVATSAGCIPYPQRVPGPLAPPEGSDAPAAALSPGDASITVQRYSDPVFVRRPGARDDFPLRFYAKRERVAPGTMVRTGAGGRAEILYSPDASSVVLFEEARVTLGDPERDEPLLCFHSLTRALLTLTGEDRIELVGGASLRGDPERVTGPILLDAGRGRILRITNQSKVDVSVEMRDRLLGLAPGESLDLPLLATGTGPIPPEAEPERLELEPGLVALFQGEIERETDSALPWLAAQRASAVRSLGLTVTLAPGERVRFFGLSDQPPAAPADASVQP